VRATTQQQSAFNGCLYKKQQQSSHTANGPIQGLPNNLSLLSIQTINFFINEDSIFPFSKFFIHL
jgi:hypothetical protein